MYCNMIYATYRELTQPVANVDGTEAGWEIGLLDQFIKSPDFQYRLAAHILLYNH
jgi:hypothetical protein